MYFASNNKAECCGCSACVHSCPVSAISFVKDEEGFEYPKIDLSRCIHCGLCEKVCPVENPLYENSEKPITLAAYNKDSSERGKSSSGGVFYVIAHYVIQKGGTVYGATMDEHLEVKHIEINSVEDLWKLRGSKYVQSNLGETFLSIRDNLKNNKLCYFTGTGCQVAGLKSYLRKPYENLITSDVVCHGVPSQWIFNQHIAYLESSLGGIITKYQFRDNSRWRGCEIFELKKNNGRIITKYNPTYELSPYLYGFMHSKISRYSCYDCKFACIPRQGDITLADFWGVKKFFPDMDTKKGVSMVCLNSEKGEKIWGEIKDSMDFKVSNIEDASAQNGNLIKTSIVGAGREKIYLEIREKGYGLVAKKELRSPLYMKIRVLTFLQTCMLTKPLYSLYRKLMNR